MISLAKHTHFASPNILGSLRRAKSTDDVTSRLELCLRTLKFFGPTINRLSGDLKEVSDLEIDHSSNTD